MDGFIKETAVSMLEGYCPDMIRELILESDDMGITILDATDKFGNEYGWGIAEYSTLEKFFGKKFSEAVPGFCLLLNLPYYLILSVLFPVVKQFICS